MTLPSRPPADLGRVALVHDYLTQRGGAERVVLELCRLFPDAPLYTSIYDQDQTFQDFREVDVRTSPLQGRVDGTSFRRQVLRYPAAFRSFDLSRYDTVLVSSSAFAHHVDHRRAFVYCYTPPRFLWEPSAYFSGPARVLASGAVRPLRIADKRAARRARSYVGISMTSAARIRTAYGFDPHVIHPPLSIGHLPSSLESLPSEPRALVVSRLLPYKRVDLAIDACREVGIPLTIVGSGPSRDALEARAAGSDVTFRSHVHDHEMAHLYRSASVVLVPGIEDFGLVPIEANYSGRPVVSIGAGGPLETAISGVNGVLVGSHGVGAWTHGLVCALETAWSPEALRSLTSPYQIETFNQRVLDWLGQDSSEAGAFIYGGNASSADPPAGHTIDPRDHRDSSVAV